MWRSLVAHLTGGQGAAGSNPAIPTSFSIGLRNIQGLGTVDRTAPVPLAWATHPIQ